MMYENQNGYPCCDRQDELCVPGCARDEESVLPGMAPVPEGPEGPHGPHGPHGPEGPHGPRGPEGPHGPHGPEGPHGPRSPEGPHGPHGPEGPHGPRGPEGPHGPHGPEGPHGPHGPHGPRGPHIDPEQYEKLDTDGKLLAMLHALDHASRFYFDERGGQSRALHILREDEAMTQRELTERMGIQPGSASEIVGKLERAGLIVRTPSETDRRTADVRLTEAGRARRREQEQAQRPELFAVLSEEEKQALLALLERLHAAWREMAGRERPGPRRGRGGEEA